MEADTDAGDDRSDQERFRERFWGSLRWVVAVLEDL